MLNGVLQEVEHATFWYQSMWSFKGSIGGLWYDGGALLP